VRTSALLSVVMHIAVAAVVCNAHSKCDCQCTAVQSALRVQRKQTVTDALKITVVVVISTH
jgi:hypothetical protein